MGLCNPVDHEPEVAEVAHAEALLGAEREHGHQRTGTANIGNVEVGLGLLVAHCVAVVERRQHELAIVAALPHLVVGGADGHKLELHHLSYHVGSVEIHHPFVDAVVGHLDGILNLPCAERIGVAQDEEALASAQLRRANLQAQSLVEMLALRTAQLVAVETLGEGRAVAETVARHVEPAVVEAISAVAVVGLEQVAVSSPLTTSFLLSALDAIEVLERIGVVVDVDFAVPIPAIDGSHVVLVYCFLSVSPFLEHVYQKLFTEDRLVVDMKQ